MPKPNIFCYPSPTNWDEPHAHKICLRVADRDKFDALPRSQSDKFIVADDRISKKWFALRRHPCGEGCYCGAQAMEIPGPDALAIFPPIPEIPEDDEDGDD